VLVIPKKPIAQLSKADDADEQVEDIPLLDYESTCSDTIF
jgi:hypothetical protein